MHVISIEENTTEELSGRLLDFVGMPCMLIEWQAHIIPMRRSSKDRFSTDHKPSN